MTPSLFNRRKGVYGVAFCLLLAGCATPPRLPPRPAAIEAFDFSGRLLIEQGAQRHHVHIDWQHTRAGDTIVLATPLGQGVAEIVRSASGARLRLADRREYVGADGTALAEQLFGFRLPVDAAPRWLLDQTVDLAPWRARVVARESEAADALPSLVEFEYDDIRVSLKIDAWSAVR